MNPEVVVKDGVHIIVGPDFCCECGTDVKGNPRTCQDILQDMVNRHLAEYADGKWPEGSGGEDAAQMTIPEVLAPETPAPTASENASPAVEVEAAPGVEEVSAETAESPAPASEEPSCPEGTGSVAAPESAPAPEAPATPAEPPAPAAPAEEVPPPSS